MIVKYEHEYQVILLSVEYCIYSQVYIEYLLHWHLPPPPPMCSPFRHELICSFTELMHFTQHYANRKQRHQQPSLSKAMQSNKKQRTLDLSCSFSTKEQKEHASSEFEQSVYEYINSGTSKKQEH